MAFESSTKEFLLQLKSGDGEAAKVVFQRFAKRLAGLARGRLNEKIRQKVDPEDIVQSVFRSFFARSGRGELDFGNWEGIWGLLVLLTIRKCGRRAVFYQADCRDVRRELPNGNSQSLNPEELLDVMGKNPTPEEAAYLAEATEIIMAQLKGEKDRKILELSLQGFSIAEISSMVGHYERGVERVRAKIKSIIVNMMEHPS